MPLDKAKRRNHPPATEEFMLNKYKVVPCSKRYPHNWKRCPFAHEGEAARRRDPRTHAYSDVLCPQSRKGQKCPRGESCPFTHNLFEFWLLPSRFKTQLCSKRDGCKRPFCFFAHFDAELRNPQRADEGVELPQSNWDELSMLHDSFGSHACGLQGYPSGWENEHARGLSLGQGCHQSNIWDFFEPSQGPLLPEAMLPTFDQGAVSSPPLGQLDCIESSWHQQLLIDNLQAGVYSMLGQADYGHSFGQPEVHPSTDILKSLCSGRAYK